MKRALVLLCVMVSAAVFAAEPAVVARVNGTPITQRDLDSAIEAIIPQLTFHGSVSKDRYAEFSEKALDDLIIRELQYQDAQAKGLKADRSVVKERMKVVRDRYSSKKEYQNALAKADITEDGLELLIKKEVLVAAVVDREVKAKAVVSDKELREYYDKNTFKFNEPEKVRLRIISAKEEPKAVEALSRIKAGEDFGKVASMISADSYRVMGGDIGFVHRGRVLQELEDVAFSMKTGEVSGIIKAGKEWYILKVEEKKPERLVSFEDARAGLKKDLEAKRTKERTEAWIAELRSKAKIEILMPSP